MRRFLTISFITLALIVAVVPTAKPTVTFTTSATELSWWPSAHAAVASTTDPSAKTLTPLTEQSDAEYGWLMIKIMSLFAWFVGIAMITLNYATYYTVVTMGNYVNNLSAIGLVWSILRDLGNIILIFGFLAIGICVILDVSWYGGGTKMLPKLLLAAVFLNFSLFISEAVIDAGNLFATQFYTQINGGEIPSSSNLTNRGLSDKILSQMGLTTIYGDLQNNEKAKEILKGGNPWIIGFMGVLLFIVLAFVLFALAFTLISRFVILILLIMLAPIGFAGMAVPKLSGYAKQWWDELFKQTITAPILFLLLYVALRIITANEFLTGFKKPGESVSWMGAFGGKIEQFAPVLLSFLVAMGFLLAVVVFTKKIGAFGAGLATKMSGMAVGSFVGRGVIGGVSLAGRGTLGLAGRFLNKKSIQARAAGGGIGGTFAKLGAFAGRNLEGRTFDLRNVKTLNKAGGAITKALSTGGTGFESVAANMGKGASITAKQAVDKTFAGYKYIKPGGDMSRNQENEYRRAASEVERNKILRDVKSSSEDVRKVLSRMSTKELEELNGIKKGIKELVTNLSPQQFEALMKSDKLTDVEKGNIKEKRYGALNEAIKTGNDTEIQRVVGGLSKGELESMPAEMVTDEKVLKNLNDKQRETLANSNERTAAEREAVRKGSPIGRVIEAFNSNGDLGPINAAKMIRDLKLTPAQIAELPNNILTTGITAAGLKIPDLDAIQKKQKLTSQEMHIIGVRIREATETNENKAVKEYVTKGAGAAMWS